MNRGFQIDLQCKNFPISRNLIRGLKFETLKGSSIPRSCLGVSRSVRGVAPMAFFDKTFNQSSLPYNPPLSTYDTCIFRKPFWISSIGSLSLSILVCCHTVCLGWVNPSEFPDRCRYARQRFLYTLVAVTTNWAFKNSLAPPWIASLLDTLHFNPDNLLLLETTRDIPHDEAVPY